jgi:hypothetical protein
MPRSRDRERGAARVKAYLTTTFVSYRDAERILGICYTTLWRATNCNPRGPSIEVCESLADHSGLSISYFRGRTEQ